MSEYGYSKANKSDTRANRVILPTENAYQFRWDPPTWYSRYCEAPTPEARRTHIATIALDNATPCVKSVSLFQSLLPEDENSVETATEVRTQAALVAHAAKLCGDCPLRAQCLTNAIVLHDVVGFVAGTAESQRREIRARLGVTVEPEGLDSFAGVSSGRNFDHAETHQLRQANPTQPLSATTARVGCSVSTVKRHLRRAESQGGVVKSIDQKSKSGKREMMKAAAEVLSPASSVA